MNKILLFILLVLSALCANAQSQSQQAVETALVNKVDSLEHELSYLRVEYEMQTFLADIKILSNNIQITANEIQISIWSRNFNKRVANVYSEKYDVLLTQVQKYSELAVVKKDYVKAMVTKHNFSVIEVRTLKQMYDLVDLTIAELGSALNLYKISTDAYSDYCKKYI